MAITLRKLVPVDEALTDASAGSLQDARDRGIRRAVVFTGETNPAAQAAYVAIGFRPVGDYGIVLFA